MAGMLFSSSSCESGVILAQRDSEGRKMDRKRDLLSTVRVIHTLGPSGTNCEEAARHWFRSRALKGEVVLHPTLEIAADAMGTHEDSALLGCIVYPDLHTLVFSNLKRFVLEDQFIMPTLNMVLASRDGSAPRRVASHPAPRKLVPEGCEVKIVNSNAQAALDCASGNVDGCITTIRAARLSGLNIVTDFGVVPMGFTIHRPVNPKAKTYDWDVVTDLHLESTTAG